MTKEEILNGMSEDEFYQLYPTKQAWEQANKMKLGGLSGAPHNGQPTADQFFSYGSHALDKFNIPFGHFAYGGGPIYPAQMGVQTNTAMNYQNLDNEGRPIQGGLMWNPETGETLKDPIIQPVSQFQANGVQSKTMNPATQGTIGINTNIVNTNKGAGQSRFIIGSKPGQILNTNTGKLQKFGGAPCYDCGGPHMQDGGFNSAVNYGSFSVPMQIGGDPTALWMAQEQMALQKKTKTGTPSGIKPTGTNPLNFNPFIKGSDISEPDSMHTSPYNPNIAAYFKGNKVIAGPATDSGQAKKEAMMLNRGKMYKKDNEIFPNYMQQDGGSLDPSNNEMYPILDFGGLKNIIDSAAKHMKKAYGGDLTEQGGNQDFKKQYRSTFDNYIKQNTYNAMVDQEHQAMLDEFQNMPYAQTGKVVGSSQMTPAQLRQFGYIPSSGSNNMICTSAGCFPRQQSGPGLVFQEGAKALDNTAQRENMANQIAQRQGQQQGFFGNFADMYAPTVNQNQMSVFGSLFPANFTRGYEFSNKDYARLKEMGDQGQITGIEENYGPLARLLGKTGRRMFGPKSVTFGVMGPGSTSEQQVQQATQKPGTQTPSMNPLDAGIKQTQVEKMMNPFNEDAQRQLNIMKNSGPGPQPNSIDNGWEDLKNKPQPGPRAFQQGGNPMAYDEFTLNRKYSGQEDLWKYAPGAFNTLAAGIESRHDRPEMKAAQLAMMTPGSDIGPFQSIPATGRRMGDYDPNSGMFRPNQMVPVQFPGGNYGYSQMGGALEEGEEMNLSPEEIAELKAQGYEIEELD